MASPDARPTSTATLAALPYPPLPMASVARPTMKLTLEERLDNWSLSLRRLLVVGQAESLEGNWRPPRGASWETTGALCALVDPRFQDAQEIECAVSILPLFDHAFLRAWYVRQGNLPKAARDRIMCLAIAARAGDVPRPYPEEFDDRMAGAQARLEVALAVPAVIRKARVREIVQKILAGEEGMPDG